eukprot:scaffold188531_cov32-Tisochrysis_lutea.AAC.1
MRLPYNREPLYLDQAVDVGSAEGRHGLLAQLRAVRETTKACVDRCFVRHEIAKSIGLWMSIVPSHAPFEPFQAMTFETLMDGHSTRPTLRSDVHHAQGYGEARARNRRSTAHHWAQRVGGREYEGESGRMSASRS